MKYNTISPVVTAVLSAIVLFTNSSTIKPVMAFTSSNNLLPLAPRTRYHTLPNTETMLNMQTSTSSVNEGNGVSTSLPLRKAIHEENRKAWIDRSVSYYSKIMREERRRNEGQIKNHIADSPEYQEEFHQLAKKHYFAYQKIRDGRYDHAETIYRRIIDELLQEDENEEGCDHAKLAVTTLLLALHCQRMGDLKKTRSVFLNFFRIAVVGNQKEGEEHDECACSAKVLCAYALFEMKQGLSLKSLEIVQKAVQFDSKLKPVLQWKQFRDAYERQYNFIAKKQQGAVNHQS